MINKIKNIANTEDKKILLSNFFSLSILQAFTYILPLLTLPYLVRVLGVEKFGLVMFAQAFITFFNILVDYGFNLSATKEISIHRENKDKVTEIFSSVITIKVIMIFIAFMILTTVVFSIERFSLDWELYYLSFLPVVGNSMFPIWYFQGMEKMKYITIVNITSKLLFTILIFIVIQKPDDYIYIPLLNGIGAGVGGIISLWILSREFSQVFICPSIKIIKKELHRSSEFFLSRLASTVYNSMNIVILGYFTNNAIVGYYSIADKLYQAIKSLYTPIWQIKKILIFLKKYFIFPLC